MAVAAIASRDIHLEKLNFWRMISENNFRKWIPEDWDLGGTKPGDPTPEECMPEEFELDRVGLSRKRTERHASPPPTTSNHEAPLREHVEKSLREEKKACSQCTEIQAF